MLKNSVAIAAGVGGLVMAANAAQAQDTLAIEVSYADLNLRSEAGVERFDRRIDHAVDEICVGDSVNITRLQANNVRLCRRETLANTQVARDEAVRRAQSGEVRIEELASLTVTRPAPRN